MGTTENATGADEIELLCGILLKIARQDLLQRLEQAGTGLRPGHYLVLRALSRRTSTLAELSRSLILDPSTLLPMIDHLEQKGLLQRLPDPSDRRRTPLTLTAAGKALLVQIPPAGEDSPLIQILQRMGTEKCQQLTALLAEVVWPFVSDQAVLHASPALRALAASDPRQGER